MEILFTNVLNASDVAVNHGLPILDFTGTGHSIRGRRETTSDFVTYGTAIYIAKIGRHHITVGSENIRTDDRENSFIFNGRRYYEGEGTEELSATVPAVVPNYFNVKDFSLRGDLVTCYVIATLPRGKFVLLTPNGLVVATPHGRLFHSPTPYYGDTILTDSELNQLTIQCTTIEVNVMPDDIETDIAVSGYQLIPDETLISHLDVIPSNVITTYPLPDITHLTIEGYPGTFLYTGMTVVGYVHRNVCLAFGEYNLSSYGDVVLTKYNVSLSDLTNVYSSISLAWSVALAKYVTLIRSEQVETE